MIEVITYSTSVIVGGVLGILYFGGLYLTLRFTPKVRHPILLVVGSYFCRLALFAAGAGLIAYYFSVIHILLLLAGTIFARFILLRKFRVESKTKEVKNISA